jgi:pro-kumamolisin-like protein/Big-like domain-containing protein
MRATLSFFPRTAVLFAVFISFTFLTDPRSEAQSASAASATMPQTVSARPLITETLDEAHLTVLKGNTHPLARPEFDLGTAPASLPVERMLLVLKRSPEQETALRSLLDDQQDKASPNYHKWLSPTNFGKQFGPSDADIQTITSWLQSHGFQVSPTKGRTVIEFSGSASQVQEAFHTAIHKYLVRGEQHWANASDPQIPTALSPAVAGVDSLHNFGRNAMSHFFGVVRKEKASGKILVPEPQFTFPVPAQNPCNAQDSNCYVVGPYDFATIYNVLPLWNNTTTPIDGTGQHIGIVQNSNINLADPRAFRTIFGLPANDPHIVLDGPDPGVVGPGQFGSESEANLDVQWSGAVAKGATIDLVVSADTDTTAGTDLSAAYIIENNLDDIMSESFGACEAFLTASGNQFFNALWEQAAAQGISVFVSSGDEGSASCDRFQGVTPQPAVNGLAVSGIASTPFNVAVGGTDFNDVFNPQSYWNMTNNPNQASARGYIPETTWNNSCTNALFADVKGGSTIPETNCNNPTLSSFVTASGGSGGASNCSNFTTTGSCLSGYPKPSWQVGAGVPNDGVRDLPDVSLFASNGFAGNFYVFCQGDVVPSGSCDLNAPYADFGAVGGTSVSSPAMAGIMALVNQKMNSRQGNPNYVLYKLAAQFPAAFHDITSGTIRVPCQTGSLDCTTSIPGDQVGIINGYDAGIGYDLATGLGSVDANSLVTNWSSVTFTPTSTILSLNGGTAVQVPHGTAVPVQITVTPSTGTVMPTGDVSLLAATGPSSTGQTGVGFFPLTAGAAAYSTSQLPGGTYNVTAHYPGDGTFGASDSPGVSVTVTAEPSTTTVKVLTADQFGNVAPFSSGPFGSFVYVRADVVGTSQKGIPTGAVTFTDTFGNLPGGQTSFQLNSQGNTSAANGITTFDAGSHSISASYTPAPGEMGFSSSVSSQPQTFTISPGFFVASGPAAVTVASPGLPGTTTIGILASSGFPTPISVACLGLPTEASCTPLSLTGGGPNTMVSGTITVTTTAPHTTEHFTQRRYYVAQVLTGSGFALAGVFFLAWPKGRRHGLSLTLIVLALLVTLPACGGGSSHPVVHQQDPGTPLGTYAITVSATAGSVTQSTSFTLVVN